MIKNEALEALYTLWCDKHGKQGDSDKIVKVWDEYEALLNSIFEDQDEAKMKLSNATTSITAAVEIEAFEAGLRMGISLMAEGE